MRKLYDLARGTVRLKVSGAQPERILNFCAEKGIEFWDASPCEDFSVSFSAFSSDCAAIMSQSGKNGLEIELLSEKGGRKLASSVKRRAVFVVLAVVSVTLASVSSLFLWNIEIEGNDKLSDAQILRALSDCGVDYGVFWPSLSSDEVRSRVVAEMPEIAWLSLNVRSSRAHIVVHERLDKPEIVNEKAPCDIVAAKSGVIKRMSVLEGESAAVPGSAVAEGDVLVRGLMSSETGDERHVHSMAQVIADTWYEISAQTPLTEDRKTEKVHTDTAFSLIIGKKRINFFSDSRNKYTSCDKINKLRYISLGDVFTLPLGYAIESTTQYETKAVPIDEKESVEHMKADLRSELQRRIGDGQIVSEEYSVSKTEGLLTVTLRAQCTENIAREAQYD
ncbi:MAG: sporulation protein YqfD [Oscillospiraceae bacterium]